jgi:ribonuclease P protein component
MKKDFIMRGKSDIDNLFEKGKYLSDGFVMIKFLDSESTKFLFAVSSKKFKRAVDRNKIKRYMKESVRGLIVSKKNIAIVYVGVGVPELSDIKESITKLLNKI